MGCSIAVYLLLVVVEGLGNDHKASSGALACGSR